MPEYRTFASVSATREVLEAFGLSAKYSLGQNFLVNDGVLRKVIALAEVSAADEILEVGPGIGTLTRALFASGARVLAVEYDEDLPAVLAQTCAPWQNAFSLIVKDALRLTPEDVDAAGCHPTKLVANLPYEVAATVVLQYIQTFPQIESMTFMVQREVADRMTAAPGSKDYGAYTVKLGLHARPTGRFEVAASSFYPKPRVESAVVRFDRTRRTAPDGHAMTAEELAACAMAADAAFANRRKTIANSAKAFFAQIGGQTGGGDAGDTGGAGDAGDTGGAGGAGDGLLDAFLTAVDACGLSRTVRGEALGIDDFVALGCAFYAAR